MSQSRVNILLIEDNPGDVRLLEETLVDQTGLVYVLTSEACLSDGVAYALDHDTDVVLLDLSLPDSYGLDTFLTAHTRLPDLPIVILSGNIDETMALEAVQTGAQDYLIKGRVDGPGLARTIRYAIERRNAERALEESEERYRSLVEDINDGIYVTDERGVFTFVNRALARIQGAQHPDELVGHQFTEYIEPSMVDEFWSLFNNTLETGQASDVVTVEIVRTDGTHAVVEVKPVAIVEDGRVVGSRAVVRDVTERIRSETRMRLLTTALEAAANNIMITDIEGTIQWVNPAFTTMTGYTAGEVIDQNPRFLKSGHQDKAFYHELWDTILAGRVWQGELVNQRKDGSIYTEDMTIAPVHGADETITHFIAVKQDMTERQALEEQLRQSQKMEGIGKLAGGVAHDFNNILTVISGYSELLQMMFSEDDPVYGQVEEIKQASERAARLTAQLLAFSRRQMLQPRSLNLNEVISEGIKMLRRLIGEDIELITTLAPQLSMVKADTGQIDQVIMNLAVNARDAMPQGGTLIIETANVELDDEFVQRHVGARAGPHVMLAISDTGSGMDRETQTRVFEPFFTTKSQGKGTGLGLSTVYGIVKQSNGSIWIYSEKGLGTTVKIYLPVADETVDATGPSPQTTSSKQGTETLLLVEDEEQVRNLASRILSAYGYTVIEAADGQSALGLIQENQASIHLLITDVVMPRMSGRQLADQMPSTHPGIKVLYMSGYTDDAIVHHGIVDADIEFIQKPFTPAALAQKVRDVLDTPVSSGK